MKRFLVGILSLLSFQATAEATPGDAETWVRSIRSMVKTEQAVLKKNAVSDKTSIALMIPAPEILAEPGKLSETGRQVLESADTYARQAGSKLKVLLPEEKTDEKVDDCMSPVTGKNGLAGAYVYIFIRD